LPSNHNSSPKGLNKRNLDVRKEKRGGGLRRMIAWMSIVNRKKAYLIIIM